MTMTKNAVGNLIARYKSVLQNCSLLNAFGTLALAGAVVLGGVSGAMAADYTAQKSTYAITPDGKAIDAGGVTQSWASFEGNTVTLNLADQTFSSIEDTSYGVISNNARGGTSDFVSQNVIVNGGTLSDNKSTNAAGAMTLWTSTNMNGGAWLSHEVNGTVFSGNTSANKGGALFIAYQTSKIVEPVTASVAISEAEFSGNSSADGGAIYNESKGVTITGSTFAENEATGLGGAIYNEKKNELAIDKSTFTDNTAGEAGGAIVNLGTITSLNADFTNNSATYIGGAIANNFEATISTITGKFTENYSEESGGAIYNEGTIGKIENSTFANNTTDGVGGAIYNNGGTVAITDTSFSDNVGGAIYNDGGTVTVSGETTFTGNNGNGNKNALGGAISNIGGNLTVEDGVVFDGNSTTNTSGNGAGAIVSKAFASSTGNATLEIGNDVQFTNNKSDAVGALYVHLADNLGTSTTTSTATIGNNVLFEGNTSERGAGAVSIVNQASKAPESKASLEIGKKATFKNNTAAQGGGALVATYKNASFSIDEGAVFEGNTDTSAKANSTWSGGGAILIQSGAKGELKGATFTDNSSTAAGGAIRVAGAETVLNFTGDTTFSGNKVGETLNDIHNEGIINISGNMTLDGGITGNGTANFKSGSILTLGEATSIAQGTVNVTEGAKLVVTKAGDFTVNNAEIASGAWGYKDTLESGKYDDTTLDLGLLRAEAFAYDADTDMYTLTTALDSEALSDALGDSASSEAADFAAEGLNKANQETTDLITAVVKGEKGGEVIESMAQGTTVAAVVPGLSNVSAAATTNMGSRTSIVPQGKTTAASETSTWLAMNGEGAILPTADGGNMAQGFGIWFMPMYNHTSADGFSTGEGNYGYDTDIIGATLGADYTFTGDFRLGLAFNVGSGSSSSTGATTGENDFDYYGLSVYGAKHFDQFGLSFDMGYTVSENSMEQEVNSDKLLGDADASLITVGAKAEYLIPLDSFNVTPYAGVRFNYYDIDAYDTDHASGTFAFRNESSDSTVWEIPVGVTLDTTTKVGSWDMTPSLGLGVKFAMGDLDAEQRVNFGQDSESIVFASEVTDEVTFQGALGLGFAKDECTIGFNYNLDLSENVESHGLSVNLRYDF